MRSHTSLRLGRLSKITDTPAVATTDLDGRVFRTLKCEMMLGNYGAPILTNYVILVDLALLFQPEAKGLRRDCCTSANKRRIG